MGFDFNLAKASWDNFVIESEEYKPITQIILLLAD